MVLPAPAPLRRAALAARTLGACACVWIALAGAPAAAQASDAACACRADAGPQLTVSATAWRDVVQDRVSVRLHVEREAAEPGSAQAQVSAALGPELEQLKKNTELEVHSAGYRTDPVWQDSRIVAWRTRGSIEIEAKPSEAFNRLVGELAGRLNIESLAYSLSREARLATEQDLIPEAVSAFRARAEAAASALGFRGYSVRNVSVEASGPIRPEPIARMTMSRATEAAAAPLPGAEGRSTVTVTVAGSVALEH